jgi:hypothetical protein
MPPRFEVLSGAVNGVNLVFFASTAYKPGTTAVYLNGQLLNPAAPSPSWLETSPSTGEVTFDPVRYIPLTGDVVQMFFLDLVEENLIEEITTLFGVVFDAEADLVGLLSTPEDILGEVSTTLGMTGQMFEGYPLEGVLQDHVVLEGQLYEEC